MKVTKHTDSELVNAVRDNLGESGYYPYVDKVVNDVLGKYHSFLLGGAVRDPIIRLKYGVSNEVRDFDILVDDSQEEIDFKRLLSGFDNMFYSRFGSPKWKPKKGLEIDIVLFSNAMSLRGGKDLPVSVDTILTSVDITTSAIAYSLRDNVIYSCGAMEAIENREVDILRPNKNDAHVLMCRMVLHAKKLGFKIGQKGINHIAEGYSPDLDILIKEYMEYKGFQDKFELVVEKLREIKS